MTRHKNTQQCCVSVGGGGEGRGEGGIGVMDKCYLLLPGN